MEEKRIIDMFWERDERVLEIVRKKYGKLCRAIAYNLLGSAEDTEERENDAYLAACVFNRDTLRNSETEDVR
ncbi:MAG: hypothetical protein E7552_05220 [Ruminococcaceae bacterium]|nr:hypothetical protein [Oscillospiraceae bacterium]